MSLTSCKSGTVIKVAINFEIDWKEYRKYQLCDIDVSTLAEINKLYIILKNFSK